jgi:hypothetical protein
MQDIIEAKKRIRDLVTPLKRRITPYHLEETLGAWVNGAYDDDATQVVVEVGVVPTDEYPQGQYLEDLQTFRVISTNRAESISKVHTRVEANVPEWRRAVEVDVAFSKEVGKQVRVLREMSELITNQDEDRSKLGFDYREGVKLSVGTLLDVVGHRPGILILQLEGKQFEVYFWKFTNYITRIVAGRGSEVRTPAPYLEFTDGSAPWELPGVEEDHDVARSG